MYRWQSHWFLCKLRMGHLCSQSLWSTNTTTRLLYNANSTLHSKIFYRQFGLKECQTNIKDKPLAQSRQQSWQLLGKLRSPVDKKTKGNYWLGSFNKNCICTWVGVNGPNGCAFLVIIYRTSRGTQLCLGVKWFARRRCLSNLASLSSYAVEKIKKFPRMGMLLRKLKKLLRMGMTFI